MQFINIWTHCRFSVNKEGDYSTGSFHLLVDDVSFAFKNANTEPSGSATINLALDAGQIVRVQTYGSTIVYGTNSADGFLYSWFTGHLLYAL